MEKPLISVVIGTYNQRLVLQKVLESFEAQTLDKKLYEVIVVDSSSTDGTDHLLSMFESRCQIKYRIQPNKGKAAARNRGIREASSNLILITDADMIADPYLLHYHLEAHQRMGPACFEGLTYNLKSLDWPPETSSLNPYISRNYKNKKKLGWYYFLTGNVSFSKSIFESAGGFDESFQGYGWEDLELGYRLFQKGISLIYLKDAVNYHYHLITEEEDIKRNVKKGESARIFLEKYPELKWFLGLNPLSVWLWKRISKESFFYQWVEKKCFTSSFSLFHRFGFWFLKEHHYLTGILRSPL